MPYSLSLDIQDLGRFPRPQDALRSWVGQSPRALDLFHSNPVLAHALAHVECFRRHTPEPPTRFAVMLAERKQREILSYLGFPAVESVVRLFRRLLPEASAIHELCLLRTALRASTEPLAALGHIRQINAGVLALTTRGKLRAIVDPSLVHEVSFHPDEMTASPTADLMMDIIYMYEEVLHHRPQYKLPSIRSVVRLHDLLSQECLQLEERRLIREEQQRIYQARCQKAMRHKGPWHEAPFPEPPFPGSADIEPLTSDVALVREAREMGNCLASYRSRVRKQPIYLYRVLRPERATLCLKFARCGFWFVDEIKLSGNHRVSPATESYVRQWLLAAQASPTARLGRAQGGAVR